MQNEVTSENQASPGTGRPSRPLTRGSQPQDGLLMSFPAPPLHGCSGHTGVVSAHPAPGLLSSRICPETPFLLSLPDQCPRHLRCQLKDPFLQKTPPDHAPCPALSGGRVPVAAPLLRPRLLCFPSRKGTERCFARLTPQRPAHGAGPGHPAELRF